MSVEVFVGETEGTITNLARGAREFYWDTIFSPDTHPGLTYAEICADLAMGVREKMKVSQSMRAVRKLAEYRARRGANSLFANFGS
jgi:inosine/xanthosine triphosphate pyrophosphatase family protein